MATNFQRLNDIRQEYENEYDIRNVLTGDSLVATMWSDIGFLLNWIDSLSSEIEALKQPAPLPVTAVVASSAEE